jgi:hypothetical protein
MLKAFAAAAVGLALNITPALAGDLIGEYSVVGNSPGSSHRYSGSVTVDRTGDSYHVVWHIGRETYSGTGIGSQDGVAISYRSGNVTGIAIYYPKGDNWEGVWTVAGGRTIGLERWTRR